MTTSTVVLIGATVLIEQSDGDRYTGEVVEASVRSIVLRNYTAQYDWGRLGIEHYGSPYADDEVLVRIDDETHVVIQGGDPSLFTTQLDDAR